MIKIIYYIFLAALLTGFVSAQNLDISSVAIFISPSGFTADKDPNEFYTNYYRRIYKDSTIVNPNYIMPSLNIDFSNSIFYLPIDEYDQYLPKFQNSSYLDFFSVDQYGNYNVVPGILSRIFSRNLWKKK